MYINRRIELEAWDIEINFRRMQARLDAVSRGKQIAASLLVALAAVFWLPEPSYADGLEASEQNYSQVTDHDSAKNVIEMVLERKDFNTQKLKRAGA